MRELHTFSTPGQTLYAVLLDDLGKVWNLTLSDWEELDAENWGDYDVQFTEAIAGIYLADAPFAASRYYGCVYRQVGATPDINDTLRMVINTVLASADDAVLLAISALNNLSAAGAQAAAAAALAAYDAATGSDVPSAATNAAAVRTELATELGRMDETVSSRSSQSSVDDLAADCTAISERLEEQVPDGPVIVIPAPEHNLQTTAWVVCYDEHGEPEEDVEIKLRLKRAHNPSGSAYDSTIISAMSGSDGLATALIPRGVGLVFEASRGGGRWFTFNGVDDEQLELPAILGAP